MVRTRSKTKGRNRFKACGLVLNHDVLFLVMMKLGAIDFLSFSGVCKSWRSFALSNREEFMASRPPMLLKWICSPRYKKKREKKNEIECCLEDLDRRKSRTVIRHHARPQSADDWSFVGLTCGYLVCSMVKSIHHLWLVNPITRDQLHFPAFPCFVDPNQTKATIVFSPSRGRVLVVINRHANKIWFSAAGTGAWNHVSCNDDFLDLHAFKGKIYTLNSGGHLYELRLDPKPNLSILQSTDQHMLHMYYWAFVSLGENLYVIDTHAKPRILYKVDIGQMKWVSPEEKTIGEHAIFLSKSRHGVVIKVESCVVDRRSKYKDYDCFHGTTDETQKGRFFNTHSWWWYFPHRCLDVDILDES